MPLNQDFEFDYQFEPVISVRLLCHDTQMQEVTIAQIDTGATFSLFDASLASSLGVDLQSAPLRYLSGMEGRPVSARVAEVEIWLLDEPEPSAFVHVSFMEGVYDTVGNLIGLDVLSQFDFGLQHGLLRGTRGVTQR